jgi:serine/threonine protein kinase/Tfp pilus assembly protein PilF
MASLVGQADHRVVEALEAYVAAADGGKAIDRSAFLREHGDIADRLAACLEGLDLLRSAASGFGSSTVTPGLVARLAADVAPPGRLGDYRILREVGRGGMGVVYEAVQISLGRRVALKVLPTTLATDARQLQRFRVEAQAAAQLHHSNIVPVFSVGCDEGVNYYAMQFIDGRTIAEVIKALRGSIAAADGDDGAGSLELGSWAPSSAVTRARRDSCGSAAGRSGLGKGGSHLKSGQPPRCIEVDPSTQPSDSTAPNARHRWTGLLGVQAARALEHAHRLGIVHRDIKPANLMIDIRDNLWITDFGLARIQEESGLTITGDLLGTLRYMSPEQASGRRMVVDQRTDIYSLGVTLYELLTLRPVVTGRDRQYLIRQITLDEPVRPRRVDPTIPKELETIVLKAMAKEPGERYASAGEMADDLQRFLDDKPIHARPPTVLDRTTKWAKRHRSFVFTGAVALLLLSVFMGVSTIMIARERDKIEASRERIYQKLGVSNSVIDDFVLLIGEKWLALEPEKAAFQQEFLKKALQYYETLTGEPSTDPVVQRDTAFAYRRIGDIRYKLGRPDEAELAYRKGLAILERLALDPAANDLRVAEHAALLCKCFGRLLQATIRDAEAEILFRKAIAYQSKQLERGGDWEGEAMRSSLHMDLGILYMLSGRLKESVAQFRESLDDARHAREGPFADVLDRIETDALVSSVESFLHQSEGRLGEAMESAHRASKLYERVLEKAPDRPETRMNLANSYFRRARMHGLTSDPQMRNTTEAIRLARAAVSLEPYNAAYHHKLGILLIMTGDTEAAEREFRRVIELVPDSPDAHNTLAWMLVTAAQPNKEDLREAVELATRAVQEAGQVGIYWNTLGAAYYHAGDWKRAVSALEKSLELRAGGDSFDWFFLAMSHWKLGHADNARDWFNRAVEWMKNNRPRDIELRRFQAQAEQLMGLAVSSRPSGAAAAGEQLVMDMGRFRLTAYRLDKEPDPPADLSATKEEEPASDSEKPGKKARRQKLPIQAADQPTAKEGLGASAPTGQVATTATPVVSAPTPRVVRRLSPGGRSPVSARGAKPVQPD